MRQAFAILAILALLTPGAGAAVKQEGGAAPPLRGPAPWGKAKRVAVVPLEGSTNDINYYSLKTRFAKAKALKADVILLDINSPGGPVSSSIRIANLISHQKEPPVVVYVSHWAISGGAMAAVSSPTILMNSHAQMGDSQVIMVQPGGKKPIVVAPEKMSSPVRAVFRTHAERSGYPMAVCEAMVDADIELVRLDLKGCGPIFADEKRKKALLTKTLGGITRREEALGDKVRLVLKRGGFLTIPAKGKGERLKKTIKDLVASEEIVCHKGKLLTLTATEALEMGIAVKVVADREEALALLKAPQATHSVIGPTKTESFVAWINSPAVVGLLLLVGMGSLYMALKTPGFGFPETLVIVCFTLYFLGQYFVGKAEAHVEVMLFVIGIALVAVEIFAIPGFGIVGVGGVALIFISLVLALQDFTIPRSGFQWTILSHNLAMVMTSVTLATVGFFVLLRLAPHTPFLNRLTHKGSLTTEAGFTARTQEQRDLVGKEGEAMTMLRPAGRAEIDGEIVGVVTEGEMIDKSELVKVARVEGNRIIVRRA